MPSSDSGRRSDVSSNGAHTPTPTATPPSSSRPAPLLHRASTVLNDGSFAREPECGVCHKSFNILRRRHHCRACHIAVCKDCGRKAVDLRRGEASKPQWFCHSCIDADDEIEAVKPSSSAAGRATFSKRLSFSSSSAAAPPTSTSDSQLAAVNKFCIECG
ncbi:hypothetical protein ATCC90586_004376 [Pythium insidiosum]|nr:hypothetical protein ATCC90586_004376 [Pythium insidiosum]